MASADPSTSYTALTAASIPKLGPGEYRDTSAPGLRLRVTPHGVRVFRWAVKVADGEKSKQRVITIGRWSKVPRPAHVTLGEAHTWLERLKQAHAEGRLSEAQAELQAAVHPKPSPSPAAGLAAGITVRDLGAEFMKLIERRRKHPGDVRRVLEADVYPSIGDRAVGAVTSKDVRAIVEAVVKRGAVAHAGRVLAVQSQLFRFAMGRDELQANPAANLDPDALGVETNVSQRFLSEEEIAALWHVLDNTRAATPTIRLALRALLLTGARTGELIKARWEHVALDGSEPQWVIPIANQKLSRAQEKKSTTRDFVIPLPSLAVSIFQQLEALAKQIKSPWVLASYHSKDGLPVTDKALGHAMRRLFTGAEPLLSFAGERPTPHDLRRTLRTHLSELRVPWHVAERVLNHRLPGITRTYDASDLLAERRDALERWAAKVEALVSGTPAVVVPLPAQGGRP